MHPRSGDGSNTKGGDVHLNVLPPLPANPSRTSIQSELADDADIRQNNMLIEKVKSAVRHFYRQNFWTCFHLSSLLGEVFEGTTGGNGTHYLLSAHRRPYLVFTERPS
jgi:hypothetical protein